MIKCIEHIRDHFASVWSETGQTATAKEFYQLTIALFHTIIPPAAERKRDCKRKEADQSCYFCGCQEYLQTIKIGGHARAVCDRCRVSIYDMVGPAEEVIRIEISHD